MQRKPHEQTWHVDESGTLIRDESDYRIAETIEIDVPPQEFGNARLIAQAPAMARLLLRALQEEDDILVPGGKTVCEWAEAARAVLKAAGIAG